MWGKQWRSTRPEVSRSVWGCGVSNTGYLPTIWGYDAAGRGRDEVGQVKVFEGLQKVPILI